MKISEIETPDLSFLKNKGKEIIAEGGNVFSDVGLIHKSEIKPTLQHLENVLGLTNLEKNLLGSTGKKEFSGDIDIVLPKNTAPQVYEKIQNEFNVGDYSKKGKTIFLRVPIQDYHEGNFGHENIDRTGYVQVDLNFTDDADWTRFYYHSPGTESKLKGVHRNIAISSIAGILDRKESKQKDSFGRPVEVERYKWSNNEGLVRVVRKSTYNKNEDRWNKKRKDIKVTEPVKDPNKIAKILFGKSGKPSDLNSVESIIDKAEDVFDNRTYEKIIDRISKSFIEKMGDKVEDYDYPAPLAIRMNHILNRIS